MKEERRKLRLISVHLPEPYVEQLDQLVKRGLFPSRSEAIRMAVLLLLWKYTAPPRKKKHKFMLG